VVVTCYLLGISARRMQRLVESLGITRLSKSQVSVMAAELDSQVADFRALPLDQGPYTFVAADALVCKVREGGRVVNIHALVATGVNRDGHRKILGLQVTSAEDGVGWLAFFRDLTARVDGSPILTTARHGPAVLRQGPAPDPSYRHRNGGHFPLRTWPRSPCCSSHRGANAPAPARSNGPTQQLPNQETRRAGQHPPPSTGQNERSPPG
jgi:putative transposase